MKTFTDEQLDTLLTDEGLRRAAGSRWAAATIAMLVTELRAMRLSPEEREALEHMEMSIARLVESDLHEPSDITILSLLSKLLAASEGA